MQYTKHELVRIKKLPQKSVIPKELFGCTAVIIRDESEVSPQRIVVRFLPGISRQIHVDDIECAL